MNEKKFKAHATLILNTFEFKEVFGLLTTPKPIGLDCYSSIGNLTLEVGLAAHNNQYVKIECSDEGVKLDSEQTIKQTHTQRIVNGVEEEECPIVGIDRLTINLTFPVDQDYVTRFTNRMHRFDFYLNGRIIHTVYPTRIYVTKEK